MNEIDGPELPCGSTNRVQPKAPQTNMNRQPNMKLKCLLSQLAATAILCSVAAQAELVTVTSDITGDETWHGTNTYLLNTVVYVQSNAVLRIEPGTVIQGGTNETALVARDGIPNLVSALWVTRGGQLFAEGTVESPIIFTMEGDDVSDPDDIPPTLTGQWGGIVVMGRARINTASDDDGDAATPKYDLYEGVTSPGPNWEHAFGGDDDDDSSGVIRYVSIRHTGNEFAEARELNSLSMGAVGRGTVIEHVESYAGSDDGFEWWGGTVNTKWLVAAFIEDDDFDTDQGYRGTNQFWFGIKPPWQGSSDSRGFETDGDLDQNNTGEEPISQWSVYNATLIGRGLDNVGFGGGVGWNARDEAAPQVYNSIFTEFAEGLRLDNDGLIYFTNGMAGVWGSIWNVGTNGNANSDYLFTDVSYGNTLEDPIFGGVSYTNDLALNPRPQAGSPALGGALPGAPMEVTYRGAFSGPSDDWADGWTALSSLGFLAAAVPSTGEGFEDWAMRNNLPVGQDGPGDDADADGLLNAVEFALGSDPNGENDDRAPAAIVVDVDGQIYPAVTYTRSTTTTGAQVQVDAANDLGFETTLELVEVSIVDLGDGTERVTMRTASQLDGEVFFRTQVTLQ
jgi:hypothetical protein